MKSIIVTSIENTKVMRIRTDIEKTYSCRSAFHHTTCRQCCNLEGPVYSGDFLGSNKLVSNHLYSAVRANEAWPHQRGIAIGQMIHDTPTSIWLNTLRPRQHGCHFADDSFKRIFLNENIGISIKMSLKFVHKGPMNNIPALVQIMAWRRPGDKPLSEPMVGSLLTHICVTRPQWVNSLASGRSRCDFKNLLALIGIFRPSYNRALRWMPYDITVDKSTLFQIMAWWPKW